MDAKAWAYRKLKRIGKDLRNFRVHRHTEFFYDHDLSGIPSVEPRIAVRVSVMNDGEEGLIRQVWPVPVEKVRERLERGDLCYLTWHNEDVVAYHWVQTKGLHFVQPAGKNLNLQKTDFMIYHTRVTEVCKGKRINPYVICEVLKSMKERGKERGLIYTASTNLANQKSLERIGFSKVQEANSLKIGQRYISNWNPEI
ncbi:MAG: hypothetical protein WBB45_10660 [Cyclobacteriaceae bacterium]